MAFVTHENSFHASLVGFGKIRTGADLRGQHVFGVVVGVGDGGRIIRHAGNQRDIRRGQVQFDGVAVHNFDRACCGLTGCVVDENRKTASHRVAFNGFVTPAGDIARNVLGGEIVPVVPFYALAHVEGIFGGIIVDRPAFEQHRHKRAVAVVFNQIFQPTG